MAAAVQDTLASTTPAAPSTVPLPTFEQVSALTFPKYMAKLPVEFGELTEKNLEQLRRLNSVVFPVSYSDKFYQDVLKSGTYTRLGICCLLLLPLPLSLSLSLSLPSLLVLVCLAVPARLHAEGCVFVRSVLQHRRPRGRHLLPTGAGRRHHEALHHDSRRPGALPRLRHRCAWRTGGGVSWEVVDVCVVVQARGWCRMCWIWHRRTQR